MFKKVKRERKYSTKLLNPKATTKWVYHLAGTLPPTHPGCWLLGRRPKVLRLCVNFFSDLNGQPESVFVPFVKTPLFFLFTVVVSFPLFTLSEVRAALSGWTQGLLTAFVARSQAHLGCSADRGNHSLPTNFGSVARLPLTKEFLSPFALSQGHGTLDGESQKRAFSAPRPAIFMYNKRLIKEKAQHFAKRSMG